MEALNLSRTFEAQLLDLAGAGRRTTPAVICTGALGAGKTTLLRHLLNNRGNLRFAVVVNELAGTDVDSALLGAGQANAVVGLPTLSVTSGCACCQSSSLRNAVRTLLASDDGCCDLLLVETTGVADPTPCAGILAASGVDVACIVAVVDAETIASSLASSPTARLQVAAADVVVLNKVDLVSSLDDVSRAEDALRICCGPHSRIIRSRHGAVPLSSLLDVRLDDDAAAVQAFVGVVSHEQAISRGHLRLPSQRVAGPFRMHAAPEHVLEVGSIVTDTFESCAAPLCASALRRVLAQQGTSMLRIKGDVWLAERQRTRHVLQMSGRMRLSVIQPSSPEWEGPAATRLVLIGTDGGELRALRLSLEKLLEGGSTPPAEDAQLAVTGLDCSPVPDSSSLLLSFRGNPRFGVDGHALNASLMARVNAAGEGLLVGVQGPGGHTITGLLLLPGCARVADVRCHADALLCAALAHIPVCDC
jgi:G3E family GTPase